MKPHGAVPPARGRGRSGDRRGAVDDRLQRADVAAGGARRIEQRGQHGGDEDDVGDADAVIASGTAPTANSGSTIEEAPANRPTSATDAADVEVR